MSHTARIFNKEIAYHDCPRCRYLQTETPYWLDEAYAEAINNTDTGIMQRNIANVDLVHSALRVLNRRSPDSKVLDWAGGYGLLVRLLRDSGLDAFWTDRYSDNLLARGFEHQNEPVDLVTAFEVFEHFVNPLAETKEILKFTDSILISTLLAPEPTPRPADWWYYGLEHGQHIGFFRETSFRFLANELDLHYYRINDATHILSRHLIDKKAWRRASRKSVFNLAAFEPLPSRILSDHAELVRIRSERQVNSVVS